MNYSNNPAMVRVDFFKDSGKWAYTDHMKWMDYKNGLIHDVFITSLRENFRKEDGTGYYYSGLDAVCLKPYHQFAHPLMIKNWDSAKLSTEC